MFKQYAVYECDDGYVISSRRNYRVCNENGFFSENNVTCSPRPCARLPVFENGIYTTLHKQPVFGDVATAECNKGYVDHF